MADVFVSYKREDSALVRKLVAALRDLALDVWWDEDIPPSASWEATIERALKDAKAVIVCWSPSAVASENVRSEARVAREDGRLIQVFLGPCSPPLFFGERQGVDLAGWRGKQDDPRIIRIAETVRQVGAGKRDDREVPSRVKPRLDKRLIAAFVAIAVLMAGGLGWRFLGPVTSAGPETLAVLPFRALNPADANLVDAIWDDTRGALSHNPNLRVLGRQSVTALAEKDAAPADYRKKVGADYLLDADVQHVGDQIQLKLSLTRTKDGAEVWNDQVGGKLDDVFGFQQRVAREVEGRIRGRVAPAGGATARNIATSPEAYALYAQARALILKRGNGHGAMGQARELLRKVLAIDPNYAPAWADLGQATGMSGSADGASEASRYLRRALQLAPNLGHAHAALAMVQGMPPELEGELRKAIAIDPNDAEAWMWLGNCLSYQNRTREALEAYSKAIEIEPLLYPAAGNKIGMLGALHDAAGLAAEQKRVERLGDPLLLRKVKIAIASATGHPGDVVRMLLELKASHSDQTGWVDNHLWASLRQLGFFDEFAAILNAPSDVVAAYRDGDPGPPDIVKWGYENKAIEFWKDDDAPALMGRLLFKKKRTREYRQFYHAAFTSADQLADGLANPSRFPGMAPTIACVLRASGDGETAQDILSRADTIVSGLLKHGPATADLAIRMAQIRAAEGADEEAMSWLNRAVSNGWLPDRSFSAIDIADEPAFARLAGRPQFQALRQKLIARIAEERAKVPAQLLARAFPVHARMAA